MKNFKQWLTANESNSKNDNDELDPKLVKKLQQMRINGDLDNATIKSLADDGITLTDYLKFKEEYPIYISSLKGAPDKIG